MTTAFNDAPRSYEDYLNRDDDDYGAVEPLIAWRDWDNRTERPARWSKLHETRDGGKTTLCGARVPDETYDSDCHGNGDRCERCRKIAKTGK